MVTVLELVSRHMAERAERAGTLAAAVGSGRLSGQMYDKR